MMNTASNRTSNPSDNAITDPEQIETAKWTRHLPEAFGIRATVQKSKYRWCVREAALWGIATGTTMAFHRLRMKSSYKTSVNVGFVSLYTVLFGSYYFCFRRRDHHEKMIEFMMKLNTFEHARDMPAEVPFDEKHPFVIPKDLDSNDKEGLPAVREYVANIPERKEWQKPLPPQDVSDVFRPVKDDDVTTSTSPSSRRN